MIIIFALFLFSVFAVTTRIIMMLQTRSGGGQPASEKPRTAIGSVSGTMDLDQRADAWTVLDDLQLNRLLKDAAPRPNG
jgi:hypothetical protein